VLVGLPAHSFLVAVGPSSRLDVAVGSGGHHTLVLPTAGAQVRVVADGLGDVSRVAGVWLSTAAWDPVSDWSTDEPVTAFAVSDRLAAVLTPTRLTTMSLAGGATTEVRLAAGRDVILAGTQAIVLTEDSVVLVEGGQVLSRAAVRGLSRLVAVRGGALALGDRRVGVVEVTPRGVLAQTRAANGAVQGPVPVPGGIAVITGDRALLLERAGRAGLAAAREMPASTLGRRASAWLEAGAPDPARSAVDRHVAIIPTRRGRRTLARLGPSHLRLRPLREDHPLRPGT
jgi:hypothetical protein